MANENETVEQACDWLTERDIPFAASIAEVKIKNPHYDAEACMIGALKNLSDRILAAHKRELAAKDAERLTVSTNYESVIASKDRIIASKDAEIAKRDALIKELADALECAISGFSREVVTYGEAFALVAKAREVAK